MQQKINSNSRVQLLLLLYSIGRKIKAVSKIQNHDQALKLLALELLNKEPMDISSLANKLYTKLSSVSELVENLKDENLVCKGCGMDKRQQVISLTKKGEEYLRSTLVSMENHCVSVFSKLEDGEIKIMIQKLNKI